MNRQSSAALFSAASLRVALIGSLVGISGVEAAITPVSITPSVTNYTGNLIASDASNPAPGYDRDTIAVQGTAVMNSARFDPNVTFQFVFTLRDASNQAVLLDLGGGVTSTDLVTSEVVTRGRFSGNYTVTTQTAGLKPATALNAGMRYRAWMDVRALVGGIWVTQVTGSENEGRYYYHFTGGPVTDVPWHALGGLNSAVVVRPVIIRSEAGQEHFTVRATGDVLRYDDIDAPPADATVPVRFLWCLTDSVTGLLDLMQVEQTVEVTVPSYTDGAVKAPSVVPVVADLPVELAAWAGFDPTHNYYATVTMQVLEQNAGVASHGTVASTPRRLMALSGSLFAGTSALHLSAITNDPTLVLAAVAGGWSGTLGIAAGTGSVPLKSGYTFGGLMNVRFDADGHAHLTDDWIEVNAPVVPDDEQVAGVRIHRERIYMLSDGLVAVGTFIWLPPGLSYTVPSLPLPGGIYPQPPVWHLGRIRNNLMSLGADLLPVGDEVTVPGLVHVAHESMPLIFVTHNFRWRKADGSFRFTPSEVMYTRKSQYYAQADYVTAGAFSPPEAADKPSNDGYFRYAMARAGTEVSVVRNPAGGSTIDAGFDFGAGSFSAHFPRGMDVTFTGGVLERTASGGIDPASSSLTGVNSVTQVYQQSCASDLCYPAPGLSPTATLTFTPENGPSATPEWRFTPDGGLHAAGVIDSMPLQWGATPVDHFAHQTGNFTTAGALIAGHHLAAAEPLPNIPDASRAVAMLFTGYQSPGDAALIERPGTADTSAYDAGLADYPGLNFRCGADGAVSGISRLAHKNIGPYALSGFSKYYTRRGGLSGIHQSVLGSITGSPNFYGFGITLESLRLSFLDSRNQESKTNGSLRIPNPPDAAPNPGVTPGFDLDFSRLKFTCAGQLESATLGDTAEKTLFYWGVRIKPHTLRFATSPVCGAATTDGFPVLGVSAKMQPLIAQDLPGELAFKPTGDLLTEAAALALPTPIPGVDSRLAMPERIHIKGPGATSYPLTGCTRAYLNNWEKNDGSAGPLGFVAFAGTLDVPFFENIRVHVHARASGGDQVWFMGGWPANADAGPGNGWTNLAGQHFFNTQNFDADNIGYPRGTISLTDYRNNPNQLMYHPVTSRRWLDAVDFDYPLVWNSTARSFSMFESAPPPKKKVFLFKLENRLKSLTPAGAEVTFGAQYEGLPKINLQQLLNDKLNESLKGPFHSLEVALNNAEKATHITDAARALDEMISSRIDKFIDAPINAALDGVSGVIVDALQDVYKNARATNNNVANAVNGTLSIDNLRDARTAILTAFDAGGTVALRIGAELSKVESGITELIDIVEKKPKDGDPEILERRAVAYLAAQLIQDQAGITDLIGDLANALLNDYLPQYDQSLGEIEQGLKELREAVRSILEEVRAGTGLLGELRNYVDALLQPAFLGGLKSAVANGLDQTRDVTGKLFDDFGRVRMKQLITGFLREKIMTSVLPEQLMAVLRLRTGNVQGRFQQYLDDMFAQISAMIRDKITDLMPDIDNGFTQSVDEIENTLRGAKMDGFVKIAGESVQHLRVNLDFKMPIAGNADAAGGSVGFQGFYEARELETASPRVGCLVPGRARAEVNVCGNLAPGPGGLGGASSAVLTARALFDDGGVLLGLDGSIGLGEGLEIKSNALPKMGLQFSVGQTGYYLLGRARGKVKGMAADCAIFMGTACNVADLKFLDKDTGRLLSDIGYKGGDPFSGIYMNAEAALPMNALLGIPDTPLLRLTAKGGISQFALYDKNNNDTLLLGYRQLEGISGRFLGVVDVSAEMALLGSVAVTLDRVAPNPKAFLDLINDLDLLVQGRFSVKVDMIATDIEREFILTAQLSDHGGLNFSADY